MLITLSILIILAALLLTLIVLVQNSKGGGLAAGFQSSNQIMGVRKTTDFLEKATWGLAGIMLFLSIVSVGVGSGKQMGGQGESLIQEQSLEIEQQMQQGFAVPSFGEVPEAVTGEEN